MQIYWFVFVSLTYLIVGAYCAIIFYAIMGWDKLKSSIDLKSEKRVSVLVAARNESANIGKLLEDLAGQNYPSTDFEVIVIDDGSEDETFAIASSFQDRIGTLTVLKSENGIGKKNALTEGMAKASHPIIATIDADCRVSPDWIGSMLSNWTEMQKMLLGPVVLSPTGNMLETIQSMEMMAIMGLTGGFVAQGHPIMANGANLFFSKAAFHEVGGYSDHLNPSGDDVFTMLKMDDRWKGSIGFVKDYRATVQTSPQPTLAAFWQQRKRWLSKKSEYSNNWVVWTAIISYLANFFGLVALIIALAFIGSRVSDLLLGALVVKTVADLILIRTVRNDLNPVCGVGSIIPAQLFILLYIPILGVFGRVKKYVWKGRTIDLNE